MDILIKIGVGLFVVLAVLYMVGEIFFEAQTFGAGNWRTNLIIAIIVFSLLAILELFVPNLLPI